MGRDFKDVRDRDQSIGVDVAPSARPSGASCGPVIEMPGARLVGTLVTSRLGRAVVHRYDHATRAGGFGGPAQRAGGYPALLFEKTKVGNDLEEALYVGDPRA
jgi:hypothetical protein